MKLRKGFIVTGIFFAFVAFCLLFASCVWMFKEEVEPETTITVTSGADSGPGSLREAIENAVYEGTIIIDPSVKTIALGSRLSVGGHITIEGNGVTLTRAASWTAGNDDTQLMYFKGYTTVTIRRVLFKDDRSGAGGAIYNTGGLTLESCIFSGNGSGTGRTISNYVTDGSKGTLSVKGCTFYGNSGGGAIYLDRGKLNLEGNLFYRNTTSTNRVVSGYSGTLTSDGYNVVDVDYGMGNGQAGWTANAKDKSVPGLLVSPASFKLFPGGGAVGIIDVLPEGYPANDFYGKPITAPASAGAVQGLAGEDGYILETTVNNGGRGSVSVTPPPDTDGLCSGPVTVTATPADGYGFSYWLVDGEKAGGTNPLELTVTDHTNVQAVFAVLIVNKFTDASDSEETPGTLRYALAKAQSGETIRVSNVTPGQTVIELTGRVNIGGVTIEGNGVTLTRDAAWTTIDRDSQLMRSSGTVTISRIHFKDGRATDYGAAIRKYNGDLTLESCIFSGNQTNGTWTASGGAIYTEQGGVNVKGCTFYENSSDRGGAIYATFNDTLTLTGNLFYGNTVSDGWGSIVYSSSGTKVPTYNVVEAYGTADNQAGWNAGTGDKTFAELGISGDPINTGTFAPASDLGSVIPNPPPEGFPATDFYGETRIFPGAPGAVK